jgi:hypothetical protein
VPQPGRGFFNSCCHLRGRAPHGGRRIFKIGQAQQTLTISERKVATGSAALLSAAESDLPYTDRAPESGARPVLGRAVLSGELSISLLWLALALLMLESWLFHVKAVY